MPPSLANIYKELYDDLGIKRDTTDLSDWAKSGVLLLNSVLTVEKDKPASHKYIGWEKFTDSVIQKLNDKEEPVVFILWGNFAKEKMKYITNQRHLVITSSHPSPFSARYGFFGSKPCSKTNEFLSGNRCLVFIYIFLFVIKYVVIVIFAKYIIMKNTLINIWIS